MRVTKIEGERAAVELSGVQKEISITLLPSAKVGDYVLVHAGFAIQKVNPQEAGEILEAWKEYDQTSR
jgi:hydrogenase expression/formation protein HypC